MNLAEFPIALIADRVPAGQKTLYFEDKHGRLTVTGSDAYGLPTATDTDVIVALIYLTKLRNNFTRRQGQFLQIRAYQAAQLAGRGRQLQAARPVIQPLGRRLAGL